MKWGWQDDWESRYGSTLLLGEQVLSNKYDDRELFHEGTLSEQPLSREARLPVPGASTTPASAAYAWGWKMWGSWGDESQASSTYLFNHSAGLGAITQFFIYMIC